MNNTTFSIIGKTFYGLENILAKELISLGAQNIQTSNRAVEFEGDKALLYRVNMYSRLAVRFYKPFIKFKVRNENQLYREVKAINWAKYLTPNDTFAIDATVFSPYFKHSKYIALKTKDALVDRLRIDYGHRPNVDTFQPSLRINVYISDDNCTLSLDSSGASLHKRGYREETYDAPINEVLAAGLILLSGWDKKSRLIDPMCGSGTILSEAALYAYNIAPGLIRKEFGFQHWKDFDSRLWNKIIEEAKSQQISFNNEIIGSDIAFKAIRMAERNFERANLLDKIQIKRIDFLRYEPPTNGGIVILNPPYGKRLKEADINELYKKMADRFKHSYTGYNVWMLSSNQDALKSFGLRPSTKKILYNGALECKFQEFKMYQGTTRISQ